MERHLLQAGSMQLGVYQNAAAMAALERWHESIAQNLAGSPIHASKRRTAIFQAEYLGARPEQTHLQQPPGMLTPGVFPSATFQIDFRPGESQPTGRNLDVALGGDGFFEVRRADGSKAYTRAGNFGVRADRTLVDGQGNEVIGQGDAPIQLVSDSGEVSFAPDGTVSQGEVVLGRLSVVDFPDPTRLRPLGEGYFSAPKEVVPEPVPVVQVQQGMLETGNASPLREMADMLTVARAYQASQKVIQARDEMLDRAIRTLG